MVYMGKIFMVKMRWLFSSKNGDFMKLGIKGFLGLLVLLNVGWQCQAADKLNLDEIAQAFAYRENDSDLMKALHKTGEACKKQFDKLPADYSFEADMKIVVRCGDGNLPLLEALKKYEFLTEAIKQARISLAEQERQERARVEFKLSILRSYDDKVLADLSLEEIWKKIITAQFYLKHTGGAALLTPDQWLECEMRAIGEFDARCNGIPRTHEEREMIVNMLAKKITEARQHSHHSRAVIDEKSLLKDVLDAFITERDKIRKR